MKGIQFLVDIKEPGKIKVDTNTHIEAHMCEKDKSARKAHWDSQIEKHPDFF